MTERQSGIIKSGSTKAKAFHESPGNVSLTLEAKEGSVIKVGDDATSHFNLVSELRRKKYALGSKYREKKSEAENEVGGALNLSFEQRCEIDDEFRARQKQEETEIEDEIKMLELEEARRKGRGVGSLGSNTRHSASVLTPTEPTIAELTEQEPPVEGATVVEVETLEELSPVLKKVLEPEIMRNQEVEIDWDQLTKDVSEHIKRGYPDAEGIISKIDIKLKEQGPLGLLFDDSRLDPKDKIINVSDEAFRHTDRDYWFLGDIHGDYFGLLAAIDYAKQMSEKNGNSPCFFYLGDLFDRGPHGHLVMLELFKQVCDEKINVGMVLGNHDEGMRGGGDGGFTGMVDPAEFVDWLNQDENKKWSGLGNACVEFFKKIPRAVFLPDGLMIAHGGVPHDDCRENGLNWKKLNEDANCLQDFVWARVHERKKFSYPNRTSKGHQIGMSTFNAFCASTKEIKEITAPVRRLLRGHDHFIDGYKWYKRYTDNAVLTLNTRCFHPDLRIKSSKYLSVAKWVENHLPEVHQIPVPPEAIDAVFERAMQE